jgi:hypothetical protein
MAAPKPHNEWFRTVSLNGRKSCPSCRAKLAEGERVWSWGEYVIGKWRTVMHFCKECYTTDVVPPLQRHLDDCGCAFNFIGYQGEKLPEWLTPPVVCKQ